MQTDREFTVHAQLPQFPGPSLVTRTNAPADNDQATAQTVAAMRRSAIEDSNHPIIRRAAAEACFGAGQGRTDRCAAIFDWIRSHVRFQQDDPVLRATLGLDDELDLLIRPARLLTMDAPAEDCDGFTMLCCAMLLASGVPCEISTIKADPDDPTRFSHVYCEAILENGTRLPLDCSHGGYPGWEAPQFFDKRVWPTMAPVTPIRSSGLHGYQGLGFDWQRLIDQGFDLTKQIVQKPGQYVQTAGGVMANQVPGAIPGQFPGVGVNLGASGISTGTLLFGGLALVALLAIGGKK